VGRKQQEHPVPSGSCVPGEMLHDGCRKCEVIQRVRQVGRKEGRRGWKSEEVKKLSLEDSVGVTLWDYREIQ